MKHIFKSVFLFAALALAACQGVVTEPDGNPDLELTNNNLSGDWQLTTFDNGATLAEGTYVYVRFIRKDTKFEMFSNLQGNPDKPVRKTGTFALISDDKYGTLLDGLYDYTLEEHWSNPYQVVLRPDGIMTLQSTGDPDDVSVFVRCTIPEEITSGFPSVEE